MKLLLLGIAFLFSYCTFGQYNRNGKAPKIDPRYHLNENGERVQPAEFTGGFEKWAKYQSKKLKYPKDAKQNGIQGKVMILFTLDSEGRVQPESVKVVQSLYESCDKEAVRIIKESPRWIPARNIDKGINIPSTFVLPISFRLRSGNHDRTKT